MNNPAAEPRGFRFFCEKSVVGEEIFNTAWFANPKLASVALSVTPQSLARETLSVRGFQPTRSDKSNGKINAPPAIRGAVLRLAQHQAASCRGAGQTPFSAGLILRQCAVLTVSMGNHIVTTRLVWKDERRRRRRMDFHPLSELEAKLSPEALAKARALQEKENLKLKLRSMRKDNGAKQGGGGNFTQSTGSRVKSRPRTPKRTVKKG
jgi:hypothetical protein